MTQKIFILIQIFHLKYLTKTLSWTSSSKEVFDISKTLYEKFSNETGFNENLIYHQDNGNSNQMNKIEKRQCKIIQSAIFKNCENEYWPEDLHID